MTAGDAGECVFCAAVAETNPSPLLVFIGRTCFVVLNLYPYNSGHVMIVPKRHVATLAATRPDERAELMELTRRAEIALTEAYVPQGLNVGINVGRPAGAGVVDHVHVHVVPRWTGDTNFMSVVGSVRVLPEELEESKRRLQPIFERLGRQEPPEGD